MSWALITGASAGIGACFARQLAASGTNLVLTARRLDRLEALAHELRTQHRSTIECVAADLEQPDAPAQIFAFTQARQLAIDTLINNAGFGSYGEFTHLDGPREVAMIQVNCAAVVHLTHLYLPGMIARRSGGILILSSTAAFQAVPYMNVYAATKAFDLLFAEGLAQEVKRYGIRVCALCPGSTESDFDTLAGIPTERTATLETAEKVARVGLEALAAGKHHVISGFANWFQAEIQRLAPRRVVTAVTERMFRPSKKA
jgi:short-subunit dehydrogenase